MIVLITLDKSKVILNPTKISGACGRLMCCLKYENDFMNIRAINLDLGDKIDT